MVDGCGGLIDCRVAGWSRIIGDSWIVGAARHNARILMFWKLGYCRPGQLCSHHTLVATGAFLEAKLQHIVFCLILLTHCSLLIFSKSPKLGRILRMEGFVVAAGTAAVA